MSNSGKIFEKDLYDIWVDQKFETELETLNGSEIAILDSGLQNSDISGPDFQNARIRIGNLTFVGDIEIDPDYRDWKSHGHHMNNKYNKVVLHASLSNKFNQPYVYTKDGRKVPSIKLSDFISSDQQKTLQKKNNRNNSNESSLRCDEVSNEVEFKVKRDLLTGFGTDRFKKKCSKLYSRLKELKFISELNLKEPVITYELNEEFHKRTFTHEDFKAKELWQQLFYEHVFEALGYSRNKSIMLKLAQSTDINFLNSLISSNNSVTQIEAALFGISGLLPEAEKLPDNQSSDYTKDIYEKWSSIKETYDGETYSETDWNFFRLRPQNFPTVRIAGGARFLNELLNGDLISVLIKKIKEIRNLNVLANSLRSVFVIKSDGFWQNHYVFDSKANSQIKYFVGAGRADEIVINVVIPFFAVYFDIFGDKEMGKKVFKLYSIYYQRTDNKIVRDVADGLNLGKLSKRTIFSQGMIELFRNYCSKEKCLECEIGKRVFN